MALSIPLMGTQWVFPQEGSCRLFREVGPGGICGPSGGEWTALEVSLLGLFFFFNSFFYWRVIALQNFVVFCQTSTWISHRYTYIPSLGASPPSPFISLQFCRQRCLASGHENQEASPRATPPSKLTCGGWGWGRKPVPFFRALTQMVKSLPAVQETWVPSLGPEDSPGEGNGTHSSTLAWRIPWTGERGRLQSPRFQRVGRDCAAFTFFSSRIPFSPSWNQQSDPVVLGWTVYVVELITAPGPQRCLCIFAFWHSPSYS